MPPRVLAEVINCRDIIVSFVTSVYHMLHGDKQDEVKKYNITFLFPHVSAGTTGSVSKMTGIGFM